MRLALASEMPDVAEQGQRWKSHAPIMHLYTARIKTLIGIVVRLVRCQRGQCPKAQGFCPEYDKAGSLAVQGHSFSEIQGPHFRKIKKRLLKPLHHRAMDSGDFGPKPQNLNLKPATREFRVWGACGVGPEFQRHGLHFAFIMRGGPLPSTHFVSAPPVAVAVAPQLQCCFWEMVGAVVVVVAVAVRR